MPVQHRPEPTILEMLNEHRNEGDCSQALQVQNLSFVYPDGHPALRSVSLQIQRGEKVALVGPNGAGKSTLMLHLNGILGTPPEKDSCPVQVFGIPVSRTNLPIVRAMVGVVFQNPDDQLFSPTVFEDVAFGPLHMGLAESEVRHRVQEALVQVGMAGYGDRLSYHLSLGEKKRIAIATVLAMHPQLLVLDEPSAGLDPRGRRGLINLLHDLPLTMLVSTHDMALVRDLLPRMVIMDEGKIVADGSTAGLMADEQVLESHGLEQP
jgi:cobalt/nickel transport system ATP-binding protein